MRGIPRAPWATGAVVLALAVTGCGGGEESSGKAGGTFRLGVVEPTAIDPYNVQESEGILVAQSIFAGMVDVKPDGTVGNRLAEERKPNDDCTEWTFRIRSGTRFSNDEPVNAESFIRGWERVTKKSAASDVAYHFSGIQGFTEIQAGTTQKLSGLSAPDGTTLRVKLVKPDCQFDYKTYHPVFSPVPSAAGEADNKTFNDQPIGNGPFKLDGPWKHNAGINLVRNDTYFGDKPKLDRVEISILPSQNADQLEYQGYQSGKFDWARMPVPQRPAAKARYAPQDQWLKMESSGMNFILPITDKAPLNKKEAREAVSLAIDRQAIIDGVFKGLVTKSTTIIPPSFKDTYQRGACATCDKPDPARAKQLAQQAGLPPGTAVTLAFNTGGGHEEWCQAIAQQLRDVLGWKVALAGRPFKEQLQKQQAPDANGLYRFAWGADYPTADNFLFPILHTEAINRDATGKVIGDNRSRYSNPEFDKLVNQARAEKDPGKRADLYQQAEKLALNDLALIPLWNRTEYRLGNTKKFVNVEMDFNENPALGKIALKK